MHPNIKNNSNNSNITLEYPLIVSHFGFNYWGYSNYLKEQTWKLDQTVTNAMAQYVNVSYFPTGLVSEGGDRELNGDDILIANWRVESNRNPGLTKDVVTQKFKVKFVFCVCVSPFCFNSNDWGIMFCVYPMF